MDLDHHCLYLSSCVGAANLRHFLVFLAFLVAGAAYGLSLGLLLGWRDRAVLWRHTRRVVQVCMGRGTGAGGQVVGTVGCSQA